MKILLILILIIQNTSSFAVIEGSIEESVECERDIEVIFDSTQFLDASEATVRLVAPRRRSLLPETEVQRIGRQVRSVRRNVIDTKYAVMAQVSPLWEQNRDAIYRIHQERDFYPEPEFWIITVFGTSEQWGHHKAPPIDSGVLISDEFKTRLDHAYAIWLTGRARFIMISGGDVDEERREGPNRYVESEAGREYLNTTYGHTSRNIFGQEENLMDFVMVDTVSRHTHTNVLNTDQFYQQLGISGNTLIGTTMPNNVAPMVTFSGLETQGFYLTHQGVSSFSIRARSETGIHLGSFNRTEYIFGETPVPFIEHEPNTEGIETILYARPVP